MIYESELRAALLRGGVDVPPDASMDDLLYRVEREATAHRIARAQAERAQAEREKWKRTAHRLLTVSFEHDDDALMLALRAARAVHPHMRLGQLLVVVTGNASESAPLFYRRDADLQDDLTRAARD